MNNINWVKNIILIIEFPRLIDWIKRTNVVWCLLLLSFTYVKEFCFIKRVHCSMIWQKSIFVDCSRAKRWCKLNFTNKKHIIKQKISEVLFNEKLNLFNRYSSTITLYFLSSQMKEKYLIKFYTFYILVSNMPANSWRIIVL